MYVGCRVVVVIITSRTVGYLYSSSLLNFEYGGWYIGGIPDRCWGFTYRDA